MEIPLFSILSSICPPNLSNTSSPVCHHLAHYTSYKQSPSYANIRLILHTHSRTPLTAIRLVPRRQFILHPQCSTCSSDTFFTSRTFFSPHSFRITPTHFSSCPHLGENSLKLPLMLLARLLFHLVSCCTIYSPSFSPSYHTFLFRYQSRSPCFKFLL